MKAVQGLQRIITRQLSLKVPPGTSKHGSVPNVEAYRKVQDLQNHFLRDDGLLVWQKRGPRDRIPYIISVCTCIGGLALTVYNLKTMAFPVKAD